MKHIRLLTFHSLQFKQTNMKNCQCSRNAVLSGAKSMAGRLTIQIHHCQRRIVGPTHPRPSPQMQTLFAYTQVGKSMVDSLNDNDE